MLIKMNRSLVLLILMATALQSMCAADDSVIGFYYVSRKPKSGFRQLNSAVLPDLGFIADRPDLTVTHIKNVHLEKTLQRSEVVHKDGSSETTEDYQPTLIIEFLEKDVKAVRDLTNKYFGEQVLIMLAGQPLCAPVIRARMEEPTIAIGLPAGINPEEISTKLQKLCKQ
jgi:hypothetical protein